MFGFLSNLSSAAVMKGLEDAWKNKEFVDITVQVSGIKFECHSLVLAVCSGLFKAHLKNSAKPEQKHVMLSNISAETFKLIMTMLYSGTNCINKDSVIELWHAAHHLQISFLMSECEKFIMSSLSLQNYKTVYASAKHLERPEVLNCILNFVANNFNSCKDTDFLAQLSGDEMLRILKHEDLEVKSENVVIDAILKWVDYPSPGAHNRQKEHDSDITAESKEIGLHKNEMIYKEDRNGKIFNIKRDEEMTETSAEAKTMQSGVNEHNILSKTSNSSQETVIATKSMDTQNVFELESSEISEKSSQELGQHVAQSIPQLLLDSDIKLSDQLFMCDLKRDAEPITAKQTSQECFSEDRLKYLVPLLRESKTCLLTPQFLGQMYYNKYIASKKEAQDIIFKATLYQSGIKDHGQWPTSAIHRKSSNFENVGLFIDKNRDINILSCLSKKWHKMSSANFKSFKRFVQITVFKNELFALCSHFDSDSIFHVCVWKGLHWLKISDILKNISTLEKAKDGIKSFSAAENQLANLSIDPTNDNDKTNVEVNKNTTSLFSSFMPNSSGFFTSPSKVEEFSLSAINIFGSTPQASTTPSLNSFGFPSLNINSLNKATEPCDAAAESSRINPSTSQKTSLFSFNTITEKIVSLETINRGCESVQKSQTLNDSNQIHLVSHGDYIYIFQSSQIRRIDPKFPDAASENLKLCLANEKIEYVSCFEELLLVFCSDVGEENKTIIFSFDTNTEESTKLTTLDGRANGLVTFQDDDNKYLLQSNGALWTITRLRDNSIYFGFLKKLWDFEYKLNGGVFYNGELFLHGNHSLIMKNPLNILYPERFKSIYLFQQGDNGSRFVPFIILKKNLQSPQLDRPKRKGSGLSNYLHSSR